MLLQFPSFFALTTLSFLGHASASVVGHARPHHHLRRSTVAVRDETPGAANIPRSNAGSIDVPLTELHLLQSETTAFQQWMGAWLDLENSTDPVSAIALLRQEVEAYEGWINAWLDSAMSVGGPAPPPLPSSIPLTLPTVPASSSLVLSSAPLQVTSTSSSTPAVVASPTAIASSVKPSLPGGEFFQVGPSSAQSSLSNGTIAVPSQTSFITVLTSQAPAGPSTPTSVILSSVTAVATPVASSSQAASANLGPSASQAAPSPSGSPSGSGQFDAQSSNNVAVYYGQTAATGQTSLGQLCQNENVDIVVLAFLTEFFGPGGFPSLNFGPACGGQTPQMQSAGASQLLSCPDMASQITQCQGLGKKVLLSLGGSEAVSAFSSDSQATDFANQLWNLFGAGTGLDPGLRPFGDVKLDGFDVDNEDHSTQSYSTFVSSLRTAMNADSSKRYYMSAAPQCPRPDASIPLDAMQTMDFVFVQFYNNAAANCNVDDPGFLESFKAWSADLSANGAGPKLYIGAPACVGCAGAGYMEPVAMASTVQNAKAAGISNFGGIMLWDGSEAVANVQDGKDYTAVVKNALT